MAFFLEVLLEQHFRQPRLMSTQQHFSRIPDVKLPRSMFDRSCRWKGTVDGGYLVPIYVDDVLPGDTFNVRATTFARLATPLTPFMDNLYADVHFFFVPNRLLMENWERLNGAQDNPGDSTDFLVPVVTPPAGGYPRYGVLDNMGVRPAISGGPAVSALLPRAYNRIFNSWYRDQNLVDSVPQHVGDGPDLSADYVLLRRGKRGDYFTTALPWPQKGPAVEIPLGSTAPVVSTGATPLFWNTQHLPSDEAPLRAKAINNDVTQGGPTAGSAGDIKFGSVSGLEVSLADATAATVNAFREAFSIQEQFELDARGGTRYVEILRSQWGVVSPDFRLQRPEFLGGGSTMINQMPIAQTSSTDAESPQGNLTAMATFSHSGVGFRHSFVEHGVIVGLLSIRADLTYQQGTERMWFKRTRFDFYQPKLAHLGEQAILNREIYTQSQAVVDGFGVPVNDKAFGYQERFAEYRYKTSLITGKFRSDDPQSLDSWHLAQEFNSLPVLGATFISENPPIERVVAVTDEPEFLVDAVFRNHCARVMPVYSVPQLSSSF